MFSAGIYDIINIIQLIIHDMNINRNDNVSRNNDIIIILCLFKKKKKLYCC